MNNKMFDLAMSHMKRGWSVLPCGKDKKPLISWKHLQERFPTEYEVRQWFDIFPEAQVGIVCGKISNLTVVDVENGGDPSFLPQDTLIVGTGGGGYHYFFKYEEGVGNKARIMKLIDFRSEGGYVVAPGSSSEKGPYTLLQDAHIAPFPRELFPAKVDAFNLPSTSSLRQFPQKTLNSYPGYGPGQRNDEMTRYIGYILTQIHPADWDHEGLQLIQQANLRNTPPLTQNELQATFESIKRVERRNNPLGRVSGAPSALYGPSNNEPNIINDGSDEIKHIATVADEQQIDQNDIYPLQMKCFDDVILGGVAPGDLIVVAGQTGNGKTSLVQDWTISLIRGEKKPKVLWFSYEVLPTHLWNKFKSMGMNREDCAFIPAKHSSGNVAWVEQKIKEGKEKFGIKMVMIDHLGFLLPKTNGTLGVKNMSSNYSSYLTQVVRDLKSIALQEEVIIFLPVHMRKAEHGSKRSDIDDIKDSSGIGQEADLVFLIEREKNKDVNATSYFTDITKITLAKNRKTGQTVIGTFSMINDRFAYDNTKEKLIEKFEQFGVKEVSIPVPVIQKVISSSWNNIDLEDLDDDNIE
jgi:hypothetical protein